MVATMLDGVLDGSARFSMTTDMADRRRAREATGQVLRSDAELRMVEVRRLVEVKRESAIRKSRRFEQPR